MSTIRLPWAFLLIAAGSTFFASIAAQEPTESKAELSELEKFFAERTTTPEQVEAWRKKFPYRSLTERLAYEKRAGDAAPSLTAESKRILNETDQQFEDSRHWSYRATSLKMLHDLEVKEFIEKSGNGFSRMSPPGARYIEPQVPPELVLDKVAPLSAEEDSHPATTRLNGEAGSDLAAAPLLRLLPSRSEASEAHQINQRLFVDATNFGYVKSLDRVAGFVPVGFTVRTRLTL
jgi:hypothetical protein